MNLSRLLSTVSCVILASSLCWSSAVLAAKPKASKGAKPAPERRVTLLHVSDSHAQLETHPEYLPHEKEPFVQMGGFARLKTALDRAKAEANAPTFLVDGGDTFHGSGPATWTQGQVVVAPFNALGFDVCVPGNWEPAYGMAAFLRLMRALSCKVITYNYHDVATNQRLFPPSVTITRGGVRIAFVGITTVMPAALINARFAEAKGLDAGRMAGLKQLLEDLRATDELDLIVGVAHTGLFAARQLAQEVPGFDVILSGHSHERPERPVIVGNTIIVEPGSMGSFFGRLDITLGAKGGVVKHAYKLVPVRASDFPEDPKVQALVAAALEPHRARMAAQLGQSETPVYRYDVVENSADNLITDAVREAAKTDLATTPAVRYSPPISAGTLSEADLWTLVPIDDKILVDWITGKQLREFLERDLERTFSSDFSKLRAGWGPRFAGVTFRFASKNPTGKRIVSMKFKGVEVKDQDQFSIAVPQAVPRTWDVQDKVRSKLLSTTVHEAIRGYLKAHPKVAPKRENRALAEDLKTSFSQYEALVPDEQAAPQK